MKGINSCLFIFVTGILFALSGDTSAPAAEAVPALNTEALGVIESFSGTSIIAAADAAAKAAKVTLFRVHVAMALGGKGFCLMTGTIADCQSAVSAGAAEVRERGLLVSEIVIPRPSRELFDEYI